MNKLKNLGCLAQCKETYASSGLGFRDERLITLERILEQCDESDFKEPHDIHLCGQFVMDLVDGINVKLNRLVESERRPTLSYGLLTNFDTMADTRHWLKSKLFQVLPKNEAKMLTDKIEEMVDLLKALWLKIVNVEPEFADGFFERLRKRCRKYRATDYDLWKAQQPRITMEQLTGYQAELTAKMLISGILEHDDGPRGEEMEGVDMGRLMKKLKNHIDLPDKFDEECAKLRRYSHWEGERFVIDYHLLRSYIYRVFRLLTIDQRIALFKYDIQMKQIHEDMNRMAEKKPTHTEAKEETTDLGMVEELKPLFYNNEDNVRRFLKEIDGMTPNDITDLVNQWVKDKRISDYGNSRKGLLWGILNEAGLYTKSRQNWNRRVY